MYGKQAEPQQPAQRPGAPVLVPSAARGPHGQPHLVRGGGAVRPLQHQFEREAKLHLQDHKDIAAAGTGPDCNDIAPGDLTFGFVSSGLQEPLGNRVERGLLQPGPRRRRSSPSGARAPNKADVAGSGTADASSRRMSPVLFSST